ncbi:MAG TPA: SHOCT domain-containing protein [Actinomycetota bacterium]
MWHGWSGWADWIWMTVGMIAFWGLLIAVIVLAVRRGRTPERTGPRPASAREILEERFARGEIDREEFEKSRAVLEAARPSKEHRSTKGAP